jgi:aminoglycoside phosphotransferase (APT) family kinase protein
MGLIDSYSDHKTVFKQNDLQAIEHECLEWRWNLKERYHRLSQVHGDYHPWNILFQKGTEFTILDRSRGEWGEPADDVAAMLINYIFFSLKFYGEFREPFQTLTRNFLNSYIKKSGDKELLNVIQPFYVWRALVLASPIWYPKLPQKTRNKLIQFIKEVLKLQKVGLNELTSIL